ncbi:aquaporin-5-like [Argonauta hians]
MTDGAINTSSSKHSGNRRHGSTFSVRLSQYLRESMKAQLDDVRSTMFWKAFLAEIIGTFFLVFLIIGSIMYDPKKESGPGHLYVAILAGFFIATIIMTFLHVSGGHVNPAISIGFLVTRHISLLRFIAYLAAQLLGSVAGAYMLKILCPSTMISTLHTVKPNSDMSDLQALIMEFIVTLFLLFAAFSMIDHGRKDVSGSIPLGIGIVVTVNILACGNKSGCLMNPALNFGPAVVTGDWKSQWIYWVGDLLGAVVGTLMYDKIFSTTSDEKCHLRSCCLGVAKQDDKSEPIMYSERDSKSGVKMYTALPGEITKDPEAITTM